MNVACRMKICKSPRTFDEYCSFSPIVRKKLFIAFEITFLFTIVCSESLRQSMLQDLDL